MGRAAEMARKLTAAEIQAYAEMARAARKLQAAQRAAEAKRRREAETNVSLSMTPTNQAGGKRGGARGQ
jgi:hypothetical protein